MNLRSSGVGLLVFLLMTSESHAATCESLLALSLENTTITLAQSVAAGAFSLPVIGQGAAQQNASFKQLRAFCRVAATLKPSSDSDIKIEVWMPVSNWNDKFQAVGNGGWAGVISYNAMAEALKRGYATSSTDTGHTGGRATFAASTKPRISRACYRSTWRLQK